LVEEEVLLKKYSTMKHLLENNSFRVEINQEGAELSSIICKENNLEYVWQRDAQFWSSSAPVLFPIIGALKNGTYGYDSKLYSVPKHGFIRYNKNLQVCSKSNEQVTLSLVSTSKSRLDYPFDFGFEITFKLIDNQLTISHTVKNLGDWDMLFSLGGHPAFNCPMFPNENYEDYYLEFDSKQSLRSFVLTNEGLLTDETISVLNNSNILPLNQELFANDALIFKDIESKRVALKSKNHNHSITLSFADFKNLGIWAKYKAPFICLEPWLGVTDHDNTNGLLTEKEGIITLPTQQIFEASFTIEIN